MSTCKRLILHSFRVKDSIPNSLVHVLGNYVIYVANARQIGGGGRTFRDTAAFLTKFKWVDQV